MHRVVLDTNVVVSGFYGGRPREVMDLWRAGRVLLCLSVPILQEYTEVLDRFGQFARDASDLLRRLRDLEHALLVLLTEAVHAVPSDPDDDIFLACAVAAQADLIVSGDRHLLDLGRFRGIRIVTPAEALEILGGSE